MSFVHPVVAALTLEGEVCFWDLREKTNTLAIEIAEKTKGNYECWALRKMYELSFFFFARMGFIRLGVTLKLLPAIAMVTCASSTFVLGSATQCSRTRYKMAFAASRESTRIYQSLLPVNNLKTLSF
jgi:hypothetical protein